MNPSNPQGSTGPQSAAGKFESSKNALTHGLSATSIDRFPESTRAAFQSFLDTQHEEWQPQSLNERIFLERYAFAQFQLLRAQPLVAHAFEQLQTDPSSEAAEKNYSRLSRHLRALERSAREALRELRTLIADRLLNLDADRALGSDLALPFTMPPVFPHHRLTDAKSTRQAPDQTARRYAYHFVLSENAPPAEGPACPA